MFGTVVGVGLKRPSPCTSGYPAGLNRRFPTRGSRSPRAVRHHEYGATGGRHAPLRQARPRTSTSRSAGELSADPEDGRSTSPANRRPTPKLRLDGAMLPFCGHKGANLAWMIELLAGMPGGNWSIDAPSFDSGAENLGVEMFILAIDVSNLQHDFASRADTHVSARQALRG
ncbi:Ldh family oxidoreductase [Rhodococcus koreensis]